MPPDVACYYALKIAVALLCGGAIGIERQWRHRISLLRTNAPVAVGAALFVSIAGLSGDFSLNRIVAQVASGVGFIGSGMMLREVKRSRTQYASEIDSMSA
jgi:putative Mg2+ transporter-C (MgtC) family protein